MDAAGSDSTIRAPLSGVDPAGFQAYSFQQLSAEELVMRVYTGYLARQKLPGDADHDRLRENSLESIRDHGKHLARDGTLIVKSWLDVSRDERRKRTLPGPGPRAPWYAIPADGKSSMRVCVAGRQILCAGRCGLPRPFPAVHGAFPAGIQVPLRAGEIARVPMRRAWPQPADACLPIVPCH